MAQQGNQADRLKFCCLICLDLLKDPVTIPCGHNYCMSCIKAFWDGEDQKIHSCPQCRKTFIPRPDLVKNTMLAELMEELKKTATADQCYAGPEDVACDVCTGRKLKAFKSCLVCLASYCEQHLQPHYDSPDFKRHKLVEASVKLQESICSRHNEVMKIFCRTDQQYICYLCSMDEHKGHDTISAAEERKKIQQRIQKREKYEKEFQHEVDIINHSAVKAVKGSEKIFTELIRVIQKRSSDVKQQIRTQQETEVNQVKELQKKLQQEIKELKKKDAKLEKLLRTEDHTQFLQYSSLSGVGGSTGSPRTNINRLWYFKDVMAAVTAATDKLQAILSKKWPHVPRTRAEFLQYSRQITLDPNTAHNHLVLSDGNRKTAFQRGNKPYSQHPDRFNHVSQVLSKDGLTGRGYWEVKRSGYVAVAVAYKSISRSGYFNAQAFGYNENSWVLLCGKSYTFRHNMISAAISGPRSSRIGVYLDHNAGILSFYSVSETMTLLHRVQTTFTQPLYAGLWLYSNGDTAEFRGFK